MKKVGIICEYNPFHYGHLRQVDAIRRQYGKDCSIIALMSGNFVQRGELALFDKYTRARMAIDCGVDVVLELPFPYAMGGAFYFAQGAIRLCHALHLDVLCFGCESEPQIIKRAARRLASDAFTKALGECTDRTVSLAVRRADCYRKLYGEALSDLPNDILALEYYQAIWRTNAAFEVFAILRTGSFSATKSRQALRQGDCESATALLPPQVRSLLPNRDLQADIAQLDRSILAYFRTKTAQELQCYAEFTPDAAAVFAKAAQKAQSAQELLAACRSKRYSDARLRRMLWSALTQITEEDLRAVPQYTLILAASAPCGTAALRSLRKSADLPLLTKPAHIRRQSEEVQHAFALCERAQVWYSLATPAIQDGDAILRKTPYLQET